MESVFPQYSLSRADICWEDYLSALTPWEDHNGIIFKRDDKFLPLGQGGIGGSKCRQLIHLMSRQREGKTHVLSGASVQSPQLCMSAVIGAHYGLPSRLVVYSKPYTVLRHPSPRISAGFGAHFEYANGPYNPIIQAKVAELARPDSLIVKYGITVDHQTVPAEEVLAFHEVGANQVSNMPDTVKRLIMPAGSCNSLVSVLLGLSRDSKNLAQLFTLGIGPDKSEWVKERCKVLGIDLSKLPFMWRHFSLHDAGYAAYSDHMKESFDGIAFHPVYEGKMWCWLRENDPITPNGKTAFWIVGAEPDPKRMEPFFTDSVDYDVQKAAKTEYEAMPTPKPNWEQLGSVTKGVWKERVEET